MMPRNFFHIRLQRGLLLLSSLLMLSTTTPAHSAENQQLRAAVDRYMAGHVDKLKARLGHQTRIEYSVGALDSRLALTDCTQPLAIETKDTAQPNTRLNLQISCAQPTWSIYLPVELSLFKPVVVAVKPLTNGNTVGAADVRLAEFNISQINGQYLSSLDEAVGKDVKRAISAGAPILQQQLEAPLMVRRGDAVVISATSSIIAVKVSGIALTDGRLGEQIRIKNESSAKTVSARIVGPGQAEVAM